MASTTLGGTLFFKINGVQTDLAGSFTYDTGGKEREMRVGPDKVHGTVTKLRAPMVDCELQDSGTVSCDQIAAIDGVTLTIELANGKTVIIYQASQIGDLVNDAIEAKIKTKFGGISAYEIPVA